MCCCVQDRGWSSGRMKRRRAEREETVQPSQTKLMVVWPEVETAQLMRMGVSGLDCGDEALPTGCTERFIAG